MERRWKTALWWTFGLGLVVGLLIYVGPEKVAETIAAADPRWLLVAFTAYALFFVARGLRWKALMSGAAPDASIKDATALTATAWLISNFVPFKAGDITRMTLMARRHEKPLATIGGTIVVERALDVLGLAVAASAGLLLAATYGTAHVLPAVAQTLAMAWALPILGLFALMMLVRLTPRLKQKSVFFRIAADFLESMQELRRSPRLLLRTLALTLLVVAFQVAIFVALFLSFDETAPIVLLVAGVPLFLLSFVFAFAPGHAGVYEFAWAGSFALLGFAVEPLLAMGIAVHVLTITMCTLLGTVGFLAYKATPAPRPKPIPTEVPQ